MHHTLLWTLINYKPNFVLESERLYRKDLGLNVEADSKTYDTGSLKNNYVNSAGYF